MTESAPSATTPTRNPWLVGMGGTALVSLFVGLLIIRESRPDSAFDDVDTAAQMWGLSLLGIGGMLLSGWLVASAICWQISRGASR